MRHRPGNKDCPRDMLTREQPLTTLELRFVEEFLLCMDPRVAYAKAGYTGKPQAKCWDVLKREKVQQAIQVGIAERKKRVNCDADRVVLELMRIALSDMRSFVEWGGEDVVGADTKEPFTVPRSIRLLPSSALTPDQAAAVSEIEETTVGGRTSRKIKLHDKTKALELLGRHLGMFDQKRDTPNIQITQVNLNAEQELTRNAQIMSVLAQAGVVPPLALLAPIDAEVVDGDRSSGGSDDGADDGGGAED